MSTKRFDDDIKSSVKRLIHGSDCITSDVPVNDIENFQMQIISVIQQERERWEIKGAQLLKEIDRQRKQNLNIRVALQSMIQDLLTMKTTKDAENDHVSMRSCSKDDLNLPELRDMMKILKSIVRTIKDSLQVKNHVSTGIQCQIIDPKCKTEKVAPYPRNREKRSKRVDNITFDTEEKLQRKDMFYKTILVEKEKEITEMKMEIQDTYKKLTRLNNSVSRYREIQLGHHNVFTDGRKKCIPKQINKIPMMPLTKRLNVRGEQLHSHLIAGEEMAVLRLQTNQQTNYLDRSNHGTKRISITGLTQCLRCKKMFSTNENTEFSCRYHEKGREMMEEYDGIGKILKTKYRWGCCGQPIDSTGCHYSHHV